MPPRWLRRGPSAIDIDTGALALLQPFAQSQPIIRLVQLIQHKHFRTQAQIFRSGTFLPIPARAALNGLKGATAPASTSLATRAWEM